MKGARSAEFSGGDPVRFSLCNDRGIERWVDVRIEDDRILIMGSRSFAVEPSASNVIKLDVEFVFPLPPCTACGGEGVLEDLSPSLKYKRDRGEQSMRGCRRCHGKGTVRPHDAETEP